MDVNYGCSINFAGEQQSVERGVGKAENCSGCKSYWGDQVILVIAMAHVDCCNGVDLALAASLTGEIRKC